MRGEIWVTIPNFCCTFQCKDGFAGDGRICEVDDDYDGVTTNGAACSAPACEKVIVVLAYAGHCQTSKLKHFTKIVNG